MLNFVEVSIWSFRYACWLYAAAGKSSAFMCIFLQVKLCMLPAAWILAICVLSWLYAIYAIVILLLHYHLLQQRYWVCLILHLSITEMCVLCSSGWCSNWTTIHGTSNVWWTFSKWISVCSRVGSQAVYSLENLWTCAVKKI